MAAGRPWPEAFKPRMYLGLVWKMGAGVDPVEVGRSRLLELEAAIERRYLKAPLGFSHEVTLKKITTKKEEGDEDMEVEDSEDNQENGNENCDKAENGLEAAEESQEVDESQEANAVPEDPMEEEAEPENEADDAPVELEEEAVPAAKSSPGKQPARHVRSKS